MGLFEAEDKTSQSPNKKYQFHFVKTPKEGTIISEGVNLNGKIDSYEDIIVYGKIKGDITTTATLVIGKNSTVSGLIKANEVRVDGTLIGPIEANKVEVTKEAKTTGYIVATEIKINGYTNGDIVCKDSLEIEEHGSVITPKSLANTIKIKGSIRGEIVAKNLLELFKGAICKGKIETTLLRTEEGSILEGSISKYSNSSTNRTLQKSNLDKVENKIRKIKVIKPKKK